MSSLAPAATEPASRTAAKNDSGGGFRPDIQGLRAIAVTVVVLYHLFPSHLPGGFVGVDVFFVISGYLITGHLWRGYRATGKISLADFWGRRAKRLVPAAAVVLALTWIGVRLVAPASQYAADAQQILASALYFQNWTLASTSVNYLSGNAAATPVQHFWSLSVEEQFYLVWPLLFGLAALIALAVSRIPRRGAVAVLTIALVAGSLAYSVWDTHQNPPAAYFVTTTRMWELGTGGLLALAPDRLTRALARQGWLAWAGLATIAGCLFTLSGTSAFPGFIAAIPVLGAAAVIAGGSSAGRFGPYRLMSLAPMVFLGGVSYSLYLWHFPLISLFTDWYGHDPGLVTGAGLFVASVLVAWLSKTFIEDPVRRASWLRGHPGRSVSVALCAVVPAGLAAVFIAGQPSLWNGPLPAAGYPGAAAVAASRAIPAAKTPARPVLPPPARASQPSYWIDDGCLDGEWSSKPAPCTYGDTANPRLTVALVGDSVAGNWWAPLNRIAKQEHWKLVTDLHGNCSFGPTLTTAPDGETSTSYWQCTDWSRTVLHDLETTIRPQLVITSGEAKTVPGYARPSRAYAVQGAGEASYWKDLRAHGIPVVGIAETPNIGVGAAGCVQQNGPSSPRCQAPVAKATTASPPSATAARLSGVPVINMNDLLCPDGECRSVIGNVLVYFDSHHLTQQFGQTLAPYLEQRLLATGVVPRARPQGSGPAGGR